MLADEKLKREDVKRDPGLITHAMLEVYKVPPILNLPPMPHMSRGPRNGLNKRQIPLLSDG